MPTIHDVARSAGVSIATVSRAMGADHTRVAPATLARVRRAVRQLGYLPNAAGRHLRTTQSHRLLVTVPDLASPFFSVMLLGIERAAHRRGYSIVVGDLPRQSGDVGRYGELLARREADGWLLLGHRVPRSLVHLGTRHDVPIVTLCQAGRQAHVDDVHIDNARAGADAVEHLHELGHRRIGLVAGPATNPCACDRLEGARRRAAALGMDTSVAPGTFTVDSGRRAARVLLTRRPRPTALFCLNDEMAMGALDAARELGLRVPHDLSLIGFDDIRFAAQMEPPLTTIVQPADELGECAVQVMTDRIAGRRTRPAAITLPHQVIVRGSTAPPPRL